MSRRQAGARGWRSNVAGLQGTLNAAWEDRLGPPLSDLAQAKPLTQARVQRYRGRGWLKFSLFGLLKDWGGFERQGVQRGRRAQSSGAVSTDGPCCPPKAPAVLRHTLDTRRDPPCAAVPPMLGLGGTPPAVRA